MTETEATASQTRTIACVLYPGITLLDLVGPLQVFSALDPAAHGYRAVVVADRLEPMGTDTPLEVAADHTFAEVPNPSAVIVPGGGEPTLRAMTDERLLAYLRQASAGAEVTASVCTGSLLLGAAGLLTGRTATTHWAFRNLLRAFDATPVARRWVEDGPIVTAAGVSAGIDMALWLVSRLVGDKVARDIQFAIEYDPEPPFGGLDWESAPLEYVPMVEAAVRAGLADSPEWSERLVAQL